MNTNIEICQQFFSATASGDRTALEQLCAEDFKGMQNGGPEMDRQTLITFALAVKKAIPDFRYENPVRSATETGFVEEHDVRGTLPDGNILSLCVVVVADVSGGQIVSMREYFDPIPAAGLMKALRG